jgi:hypothetical protein
VKKRTVKRRMKSPNSRLLRWAMKSLSCTARPRPNARYNHSESSSCFQAVFLSPPVPCCFLIAAWQSSYQVSYSHFLLALSCTQNSRLFCLCAYVFRKPSPAAKAKRETESDDEDRFGDTEGMTDQEKAKLYKLRYQHKRVRSFLFVASVRPAPHLPFPFVHSTSKRS